MTTTTPTDAKSLASATAPDRNRAVDCYRALAMAAVAVGHWLAISVSVGPDGSVQAGNALGHQPGLGWLTWVFQVMPLFFVVGGYSSARSLVSLHSKGGRPRTGSRHGCGAWSPRPWSWPPPGWACWWPRPSSTAWPTQG